MNTDLNLSATHLRRGELLRVQAGQGSLVQCLNGTLWLTQDGDLRDIVLEAGDEALIERDGLSIISALSDSRFVLSRSDVLPDVLLRARQAQAAVAAY